MSESRPFPKRRYILISGLTLAAGLTLLLACREYKQRVAVHEIERLGGSVGKKPVGPIWLSDWGVEFDRVDSANFYGSEISDDDLLFLSRQHLRHVPSLSVLSLTGTNIGDDGLEHLRGLKQLRGLHISYTNVSDNGLRHLRGMTQLRGLSLEGTLVTEDGVRSIAPTLPNCRVYWSSNEGVQHPASRR